jgi:hypothetical protein
MSGGGEEGDGEATNGGWERRSDGGEADFAETAGPAVASEGKEYSGGEWTRG